MEIITKQDKNEKLNEGCSNMLLSLRNEERRVQMREYFGSAEKFVKEVYPVSKNSEAAKNPIAVLKGTLAPTILDANMMYGGEVVEKWFGAQLIYLSEYCGCKDKITPLQLNQLAENLNAEFHYLKITEFMWFFALVSRGKFGELGYGAFSPIRLQEMVWEFIKFHRNPLLDKIAEEELEKRYEQERKNAVPCPDHIQDKLNKLNQQYGQRRV